MTGNGSDLTSGNNHTTNKEPKESPLLNVEMLVALKNATAEIEAAATKDKQQLKLCKMHYKQILSASTDSIVPKLPAKVNDLSIGRWYDDVLLNLNASPWNIDGTSIINLHIWNNLNGEISMDFKIRNEQLGKHLYLQLQEDNSRRR